MKQEIELRQKQESELRGKLFAILAEQQNPTQVSRIKKLLIAYPNAKCLRMQRHINTQKLQIFFNAFKGNKTVASLAFAWDELTPECMKIVMDGLKDNTTVRTLSFFQCKLGDEGARVLMEGLKEIPTLTSLNLSNNKMGAEGVWMVMEGLKGNKILRELSLRGNELGPEGVKIVMEGLKGNQTLVHLSLKDNEAGAEGIETVSKALNDNHTLLYIELEDPSPELIEKLSWNSRLEKAVFATLLLIWSKRKGTSPLSMLPKDILFMILDLVLPKERRQGKWVDPSQLGTKVKPLSTSGQLEQSVGDHKALASPAEVLLKKIQEDTKNFLFGSISQQYRAQRVIKERTGYFSSFHGNRILALSRALASVQSLKDYQAILRHQIALFEGTHREELPSSVNPDDRKRLNQPFRWGPVKNSTGYWGLLLALQRRASNAKEPTDSSKHTVRPHI